MHSPRRLVRPLVLSRPAIALARLVVPRGYIAIKAKDLEVLSALFVVRKPIPSSASA